MESNYDYHFIIKELAEEFEGEFNCLGENTEKFITFSVPIEKKIQELINMEKKLQTLYLTDYNLLTVQVLSQVHEILLVIFLKEFIKLSVQTVISAVLNRQTLKMV